MRALKAGVIGCGEMGRNHALAYQALKGVELVAAHDQDERGAGEFCAAFDIKRTTLSELLESVDIVSICTWPSSHCALTLEALRFGTHVLCEKPPAENAEEAGKMLEMADEKDLVLTYGLLYRHAFADIADVVHEVGSPYRITARWLRHHGFPQWSPAGYRESSGGALTDLGVHMIDLAWHLVGCPEPTLIYAKAWNHRSQEFFSENPATGSTSGNSHPERPVDDSAFLFAQLNNGCSAMVDVAYSTDVIDDDHVSVEIQGSRGTLVLSVPTTQTVSSPDLSPRFYRADKKAISPTAIHRGPRLVREAIQDQLANFRDAVLGVCPPLITAGEAVTLQRMLDLALWSARTGDPAAIGFREEDIETPQIPYKQHP